MNLTFNKLRWKNLLSYGDQFTEIVLDRIPSTIITGENGAGKSTILEALVFALYGKPYRKIKKGELVNSKNSRAVEVEVEFVVEDGGRRSEYLIRRGIKPDLFEIYENGTLLNQPGNSRDYQAILDKKILRCSYEVFTQIVVVGKAVHTPFMTMKAADRRTFVETILNLDVFTVMNKVLSSRLSSNKDASLEAKTVLALARRDVEHKEREIETAKGTSVEFYARDIARIDEAVKDAKRQGRDLVKTRKEVEERLKPHTVEQAADIRRKIQKARLMLGQATTRLTDNKKTIQAIEHALNCDACGQKLPETKRQARLDELKRVRVELEGAKDAIAKKIATLEEKGAALAPDLAIHEEATTEIARLDTLIADRVAAVKALGVKRGQIKEPSAAPVEALVSELDTLRAEEEKATAALDSVLEDGKYLAALKTMLGDSGVKSILVKRFVPMINQSINHHLSKLGFFGKFTLDQNFEETIKARGFDELGYHSYSEGEKLRIDLAVLMAWREMARLQGIINTNLLIFDEVMDASMDAAGTTAFAQVLSSLTGTNIFVVSHSPEKIGDMVRSHIEVAKDKRGFSKFKKVKK